MNTTSTAVWTPPQTFCLPPNPAALWGRHDALAAEKVWRRYNGRACVEQRIEELKNDLAADAFCTQHFFATEAAFLAVVATFNLLSLSEQASGQGEYR